MPTPIRAVAVDYGNVLSGPRDPALLARLHELTGLPPAAFPPAYDRNRLRLDRLTMTAEAYWMEILSHAPVTATPSLVSELIRADVESCVRLDSRLMAWIGLLKSARVSCAILSNMPREILAGLRHAHGAWLEMFDVAVFSCEAGCVKPEPQIYQQLLDALATPSSEILFIDDMERNLLVADQLGFETLLYRGADELRAAVDGRYELPLP